MDNVQKLQSQPELKGRFAKARDFLHRYSENIGGAISFAGSSVLLAHATPSNVAATASFTAAELTLMRLGNRTAGYSAGAALFAAGDFVLSRAAAAQGHHGVAALLGLMTSAWALGALRYPLEKLGCALKGRLGAAFRRAADAIPPLTGVANLAMRLPGAVAAGHSGNVPLTVAVSCWGVADALTGRLQRGVALVRDSLRSGPKAA